MDESFYRTWVPLKYHDIEGPESADRMSWLNLLSLSKLYDVEIVRICSRALAKNTRTGDTLKLLPILEDK